MYGIVNNAIEEMVLQNFGEDKWAEIKKRSKVDIDFFLSNEPYDDAITYDLATTAADVLGITVSEVLIAFGEHWILKTGKERYGGLLKTGGESLRAFLLNLPNFHNRIMLLYPKLTPPEFKISNIEERSVHVHYFSKREGLQDFVKGLLQGLGKLYETATIITLLQSRNDGENHEIFKVNW
ncbi:MAG: hypothetical protein RLZZ28_1301 [Bacteroidota bacterium]|jgi:hypothetical protein